MAAANFIELKLKTQQSTFDAKAFVEDGGIEKCLEFVNDVDLTIILDTLYGIVYSLESCPEDKILLLASEDLLMRLHRKDDLFRLTRFVRFADDPSPFYDCFVRNEVLLAYLEWGHLYSSYTDEEGFCDKALSWKRERDAASRLKKPARAGSASWEPEAEPAHTNNRENGSTGA